MYFEMLANPMEDETEISPVFSALRSLIDWNLPKASESENDFNRTKQEYVSAFEIFIKLAYRKLSFLRHSGYIRKKDSVCPEEPELYIMGYLLVRSVVSRWEQTLGRRIPAAVASKLLLHVTRGDGNENMIPPLSEPTATFAEACQQSFQRWLSSLQDFDKEILESFFLPVDPDSHSSENMSILSQLLHKSGTGDENWRTLLSSEPYNPFFALVFDTTSFSGIKPLNKST